VAIGGEVVVVDVLDVLLVVLPVEWEGRAEARPNSPKIPKNLAETILMRGENLR
jgi:hypothetical protein